VKDTKARIDFIICEQDGSWFTQSEEVPVEVARQDNAEIIKWFRANGGDLDGFDIFYVGVYWRDPNVDEVSDTNIMN